MTGIPDLARSADELRTATLSMLDHSLRMRMEDLGADLRTRTVGITMTTIEDEARRLQRSINERATEIMKDPEAVNRLLGEPKPVFRELSRSDDTLWGSLPQPVNNHADVLRALARNLGDEWRWDVIESKGGAEFVITGHVGKQRRIVSLDHKTVGQNGAEFTVGRVEWEGGCVTYVTTARLRELAAPFRAGARIHVEGEESALKAWAKAGR